MDRTFTVINNENEEVVLFFKDPSSQDKSLADVQRNKAKRKAIEAGAYFEAEIIKVLQDRGILGEEFAEKLDEAQNDLQQMLEQLDAGGMKLLEAKKLAVDIADKRAEIKALMSETATYINDTVEGQAQNAWFNSIVASCVVQDKARHKAYFAGYEDFINRSSDVDAIMCSTKVAQFVFGGFDDKELPENQFLLEWNFIDEDLRFINENGDYVDLEGNLVDELGRKAKKVNGKLVPVGEDGKVIKDAKPKPFLDESGKPIKKKVKPSAKKEKSEPESEKTG